VAVRHDAVLLAPRNDEELARAERRRTVSRLDVERAVEDVEHLVFAFVACHGHLSPSSRAS